MTMALKISSVHFMPGHVSHYMGLGRAIKEKKDLIATFQTEHANFMSPMCVTDPCRWTCIDTMYVFFMVNTVMCASITCCIVAR